eukprot:CAMPEP_0198265216 /NCGR_PEP_ID=MMETSP1447-20131203/21062_1 /TAXON_ID=420782 /ORGANISM="Chaetoceros dichaeta, Strain CCMP1751" /LENGTH=179 /DNA_ID=CAMNT_0043954575 /DNA_START=72 /DNA_END=607 /DNA_ORIENTATION=+
MRRITNSLRTVALSLLFTTGASFAPVDTTTSFSPRTNHDSPTAAAMTSSSSASLFSSSPFHHQCISSRGGGVGSRFGKTALNMSSRGRNQPSSDYYKVLDVPRSASQKDIKSAYRGMAKRFHPDANPGKDTTEKFQEVNRAYEVLNDPDLKKKYDMYGDAGIGTSAASDQQAGSPFGGP